MARDPREVMLRRGTYDWRDWLRDFLGKGFHTLEASGTLNIDPAVKLLLEDNASFSIRNTLEAPFEGIVSSILGNKVVSAFSAMAQAVQGGRASGTEDAGNIATFNPAFRHLKAWKKTDPITITLKFDFAMGQFGLWNAREEVIKPIASLLLPTLPRSLDGLSMTGPYQSAPALVGSLIGNLVKEGAAGGMQGVTAELNRLISAQPAIPNAAGMGGSGLWGVIQVQVGSTLLLSQCYYESASVSFSSTKLDQHGFPIEGSISMVFQSVYPPAANGSIMQTRFGKI